MAARSSKPRTAVHPARPTGIVAAAWLTAACTHVAPYERGRLAHPTMTQSVESAAAEHVHAVHEGATGGSVGASGCGCN